MKEIPVWVVTGFLEAGKTTFIQKCLEDPEINNGEPLFLLLCEEGIEEYHTAAFASKNVWAATVNSYEELDPDAMRRFAEEHGFTRVIVEYNGVWTIDKLFSCMPRNWRVTQRFFICDATTFNSYNLNMQQFMFDKINYCDRMTFNRCGDNIDRMALHRAVRPINRKAEIIFEKPDGTTERDEVVDPLPYDMDAPVLEVPDESYGRFYADICDNFRAYDGKTVRYKGMISKSPDVYGETFIFGRDHRIWGTNENQFVGMIARWPKANELNSEEWAVVTATVKADERLGPILTVTELERTEAPENPVATDY